jgi:FkbM family methyltransferase
MNRRTLARAVGHAPHFRGRGRLVDLIAPHDGSGVRTVVLAESGHRFHVDTRSYIERHLYLYSGYEKDIMAPLGELLTRAARPEQVAVDVGANIGVYSLFLTRYYHAVESFEPQRAVYVRLIANLALNGTTQVNTHQLAAGAEDGTADLYAPPPEAGNHGLAGLSEKFYSSHKPRTRETVQVVPLDLALVDIQDRVGFVKIDVEGFELQVLRGMESIVQRSRPLLLVEIAGWAQAIFDATPGDLYEWFGAHSYTLYDPVSGRELTTQEHQRRDEVLAVPREQMDQPYESDSDRT